MSNSFGGSIKLTGESDYRKALKDITSDMRLMSSEMKVLATSTDSSGKSSDADRAKKEALTKAIGEQRDRLGDLNKALQASVAETGSSSDASKRLQTQVNTATAQLNKMETQLAGTDAEGRKLGNGFDETGKKASIFGDVLKANLASEAIVGGIKAIGSGIASLGKAFVGMVGDSVKAYAEYEQLVGGVDTIFKDSSGAVQQYANDAFKTAGLSANQYMTTVTGFSASLLQGLGGDTKKAGDIANQAVVDMSDNANKYGTDISLIQNAYQGFAKDNFTMLDNLKLGYGGTASEMARLVNDSGVMGASFQATAENVKDIPFDKLIEAIHKTQTEMGIAGTTAKEASSTISGSLNSTKASWENLLSTIAGGNNEEIATAVNNLVESAGNLATNIIAIIPNIVEGFGQVATQLVEQIPTLLSTVLPVLLQAIVGLIQSVVGIIPTLVPVVVQVLLQIVNAILTNLPMILQAGIDILLGLIDGLVTAIPQLIPAIVQAITTIITVLVQNLPALILAGIQLLIALVTGIANALPQLIAFIPQIIDTLIKTLTNPTMMKLIIEASITLVIAIISGLIKAIPSLIQAIPQIITALVNGLIAGVGSLVSVGGDLVKGLWNGISNMAGWVMDKIKGFGKGILDGIKGFFGIHSPSTLFRDEVGTNLALGVGEGFSSSMSDVAKDMQNALPTSFDTDVNLNNNGLTSAVANSSSLSSALGRDNLVSAIQEAFKGVKVELDDKPLGAFVTNTVEGAIYG